MAVARHWLSNAFLRGISPTDRVVHQEYGTIVARCLNIGNCHYSIHSVRCSTLYSVLCGAWDEALEIGKHKGFEGGSQSRMRSVAGDVAVEIPEICIVRANTSEDGPIGDVGGGGVQLGQSRPNLVVVTIILLRDWRLARTSFSRARVFGVAPFVCVRLAKLERRRTVVRRPRLSPHLPPEKRAPPWYPRCSGDRYECPDWC
jgi:hypothetical protein